MANRPRSLAAASAWSHRWGTLAWALGGALFLVYFGLAYAAAIGGTRAGAAAFGLAAAPVAEGMRALNGPAARLDTYGGYVTYHNLGPLALGLSLWALIQGARAIRGWEERGVLDVWIATGRRRRAILRDRWLGFLAALAALAAGVGLGLGGGAALAGEARWGAAFVATAEAALVAAAFFGLGLLLSQLTATARAGAGLAAVAMLALYLVANLAPDLGPLGELRYLSPFYYYQQSRVMIPGFHLDAVATAAIAVAALVPALLATLAFEKRDFAAPLWRRRSPAAERRGARPARLRTPWLRDAWLADLRLNWVALLSWAAGTFGFAAVIVSVATQVTRVWESSDLVRQLLGHVAGRTFLDQYMSYVTILAAVAPAAFVVAEAARWVSDLGERRVEMLLSAPVGRSRIVLEWGLSALVGIVLLALAYVAGSLAGAAAAGVGLRPEGLLRSAADAALLGAAVCGLALLAVAIVRGGAAVGILGAVLAASFVISLLGPMFRWPEWLIRLSLFDAFGAPYVEVPRLAGLALLAGLAVVGTALATQVARLRSSAT